MIYEIELARNDDKCYICGAHATIVLKAPPEHETGYMDEVPLCEDCAQSRLV